MNERKRRLAGQGEDQFTVAILVLMVTLFIVAAFTTSATYEKRPVDDP
jgi:hypothetical protein